MGQAYFKFCGLLSILSVVAGKINRSAPLIFALIKSSKLNVPTDLLPVIIDYHSRAAWSREVIQNRASKNDRGELVAHLKHGCRNVSLTSLDGWDFSAVHR